MNWKKYSFVCPAVLLIVLNLTSYAQDRPRVIVTDSTSPVKKQIYSQPTNISQPIQPVTVQKTSSSRPVLTNQIVVVNSNKTPESLVKKTVSSAPVKSFSTPLMPTVAAFNQRLTQAMDSKLGIRYVYGSTGPYTYDCSGLVWSVFQEAGLSFTRSSARNYWEEFEPVYGDDRYKFGTLVFFNRLGHVGIVVDDKGFYHASSSKGVTYSSFEGYWEKRIVGFRKIPDSMMPYATQTELLEKSAIR